MSYKSRIPINHAENNLAVATLAVVLLILLATFLIH